MTKTLLGRGALALLLVLAACHKEPEPTPVEVENTVEEPLAEPTPVPEAPPAPPPAEPTNATADLDAPEPTPPDEQMLDDADATGMTSRVTREEAPATEAPAKNETPARN